MDLRLTLEHFNKLIGPEIEKTDAILAVQKRREAFFERNAHMFEGMGEEKKKRK